MKTILLIEPDSRLAALYTSALKTVGLSVDHVTGAQDALSRLDNKQYDGIILELDIPDHNGFEFLYEFCSYDDWSATPILIHTNLPEERFKPMMVNWRELNVVDYLYKGESSLNKLQSTVVNMVSVPAV